MWRGVLVRTVWTDQREDGCEAQGVKWRGDGNMGFYISTCDLVEVMGKGRDI